MEESARKLGPYKLVSKIGLGGFGVVWLAEKQTSIATTRFALKLPRDEDINLEAFRQEAAIWVQASGHPNVLPLIDADVYDGQVVIVSEYAPDGSLAGWLTRHGDRAPSVEAACEIIGGVLAGLAHLHERRIIHRDLKPENILLQRDTPRLADFGISRLLKSGSHSRSISGTLAYMAPEAFDGKRNEQTDIWAVGVIFYHLLAGRLPYDQQDTTSLVGAIVHRDPPVLPEGIVPEVLRNVVMKALQRDPAKRYASAAEMRRDLRETEHRLWLRQHEAGRKEHAGIKTTRLAPISRKETASWKTVLLWGVVGMIAGLISATGLLLADFVKSQSQIINQILFQPPGIIFGAAVYLFGEYSSSPPPGKRNRVFSYFALTVASMLGWYLAVQTATHIHNDPWGFMGAGAVGGLCIVSAEILCWRLPLKWWGYAAFIVIVAGLSGVIVMFIFRLPDTKLWWFLFYGIWQSLVLASHAIAAGKNKKWLITSVAILLLIAGSLVSIITFAGLRL